MTTTKVDDKNLLTLALSVHEGGGGGGVALPVHDGGGGGGEGGEDEEEGSSDEDEFSDMKEPSFFITLDRSFDLSAGSSDEDEFNYMKGPRFLYESREEEDESSEEEDESSEEEEPYTLESPIIKAELDRIFDEIHEKGDTVIWRLPKTLIIAFVDTLEEAHDYLKLNKYLEEECPFMKPHRPVDQICELLENEIKDRFNKVNTSTIPHAVQARLWQLEAELEIETKYQCMIYLRKFDYAETYKPDTLVEIQLKYPNLDSSEIHDGLQWYRLYLMTCEEIFSFPKDDEASYIKRMDEKRQLHLQLLQNQENKMAIPLTPIYALASRAYKEGYVMNPNPEMEVRKIRRYDEWLNFLFLTDGPLENLLYQARTVMVSNVSLNASTQDINKLLSSSGGIEDIKIERGRKFKTAHVTFKDFEGTEAALRLQSLIEEARIMYCIVLTPLVKFIKQIYLERLVDETVESNYQILINEEQKGEKELDDRKKNTKEAKCLEKKKLTPQLTLEAYSREKI